MRTPSIMILLASSFALAACGDDPSIVATWREMPNAFTDPEDQVPVAERATWTFGEDGIATVVEQGDIETAPYTFADGELTLTVEEPDETLTIKSKVVVTDTRFMYGALFPDGDVDGVVGTWHGVFTVNELTMDTRVVLGADQSASITQTRTGAATNTLDGGTWERNGDSLVMSFAEDNATLSFRSHLIEDEALGGQLFERL